MSKVDGQILYKEKTKNWNLKINSGKNHIIPKNSVVLAETSIHVICVTESQSNHFPGKVIISDFLFQFQSSVCSQKPDRNKKIPDEPGFQILILLTIQGKIPM